MSNYNCGTGLDEQILNETIKEVYNAVYPAYLKGEIDVKQFEIDHINWDINEVPFFNLDPSMKGKTLLIEKMEETFKDKSVQAMLRKSIDESVITFELTIPSFVVTITSQGGSTSPPVQGSILVYVQGEISEENKLAVNIIKTEISISGEKVLTWILNNIALPLIEKQVNDILLKGIALPDLDFGVVALAPPTISLENKCLTAYAAEVQTGATVSPNPGTAWPKDKIFVVADEEIVNNVITNVVEQIHEGDTVSQKILIFTFSAGYEIGLKNPTVVFDGGSRLTVGLSAFGSGPVKAEANFGFWKPSVTLSMGISALPKITADVIVDSNNNIKVKFIRVDDFKIDIDLPGVPSWLDEIISTIISTVTSSITKLIGSMLTGITIDLYKIPEITIAEPDINVDISLKEIGIDTMNDKDGKKLLAITGQCDVEKKDVTKIKQELVMAR